MAAAEAGGTPPESVDVPTDVVGRIIGINGSSLRRLVSSTGCKIEVPRSTGGEGGEATIVRVELRGSDQQRQRAAVAIKEIVEGGEVEDQTASCSGGLVVPHGLECLDRQSWLLWRLSAYEAEHSISAEVGRRGVRIWAAGRNGLTTQKSSAVRKVVENCIQQAVDLAELVVEAKIETEPENAHYDRAIRPLIQQYGVLVWVPQPEDGVVKVRIVGPVEPAKDAAQLLQERYVAGKVTGSVLQTAGQLQGMEEAMAADFATDVRDLEAEYQVKMKESAHLLWVVGESAENVENARRTLAEMVAFYMPDGFLVEDNIPPNCVDDLMADSAMRNLQAKPECAISYDRVQGSAWICGSAYREQVKKRIAQMVGKWRSENWEMDLADYGVAMWLLGPGGTGDWLHRMRTDSRADIKVCPNALKVTVTGNPHQVDAGKRAILEALERLEKKKQEDEARGGRDVKVKEVLSDLPPHMKAVMQKLAMLEAMKKGGRPSDELLRERGLLPPEPSSTAVRDRSRSPTRETTAERREVKEWNPATGQMESTSVPVDIPGHSGLAAGVEAQAS